jgi:hypothetical protein
MQKAVNIDFLEIPIFFRLKLFKSEQTATKSFGYRASGARSALHHVVADRESPLRQKTSDDQREEPVPCYYVMTVTMNRSLNGVGNRSLDLAFLGTLNTV